MVVVVVVGGGWVKVSAAMAGRRWKIEKKKQWLKRLNAVHQKTKFGPKYKWFKISYLKSFFWKYFFGHTAFLYSSTRFSGHLQSFICSEIVKASKNYRKRSLILQYSFAQKTSLILWNSTHLTLKIISSCNTAKSLCDFINFPANMFLFEVRKNICTPSFLDAQNAFLKHFESEWSYISVYLRKKRFVSKT